MSDANTSRALSAYGQSKPQAGAEFATPHRLIQMLFEGALEKIAFARGHMERQEFSAKAHHINWAIQIIEGLRLSLDREQGGELAENLDALYRYLNQRLLEASKENSPAMLDEISGLLREVKAGWDAIETTRQGLPVQEESGA